MHIQKKRAVKWSLDQVEAIPGITTTEVMEKCILNMEANGWDYTEMSLWFNKQFDVQGRPKFLNAIGGPLNRQSVSHIHMVMKKRKKNRPRKTKIKEPPTQTVEQVNTDHIEALVRKHNLPQQTSSCAPHREFILSLMLLQKPASEIHKALVARGFKNAETSVRRYVKALKQEAHRVTSNAEPIQPVVNQ